MASTEERLRGYVEKRVLTEKGWMYFCVGCNEYHDANKFYKTKTNPWGLTSICVDFKRKNSKIKDAPTDMQHFKLGTITNDDIQGTLDLLRTLGYNTKGNVHEQFMKKYEANLKHHTKGL